MGKENGECPGDFVTGPALDWVDFAVEVTGQRPFRGKTVGETINNIVNQPPGLLGLESPAFSPALDRAQFDTGTMKSQAAGRSAGTSRGPAS